MGTAASSATDWLGENDERLKVLNLFAWSVALLPRGNGWLLPRLLPCCCCAVKPNITSRPKPNLPQKLPLLDFSLCNSFWGYVVAKYNRKAIFQEFSVISLRQNFSLNSSLRMNLRFTTMRCWGQCVCEWWTSVITIWFVWHNNGTHWKVTKFNRKTQRSDKYVSPDGQPSTSGAVAILKLKYNLFLAMWFLD